MFFKMKTVSLIALSVLGFCFGVGLTGFIITESGKVNSRNGVGGF